MNFLITILVVVVLLVLAFLGLAIKVIFSRSKKFPNIHIGSNKDMKSRGITCAQSWDKIEQRNARKIEYKNLTLSDN
jgi:hypothetical protein